ncbi:hypothetical protein OMCYN_01850 [cyanobiont of Ornithocercus magnificus]|nr:hypothetical protein OMCYN_01850 [cyanobiont of Ornithocercus magnificus]
MSDYTTAIYSLIAVSLILTLLVIYTLRQPTDLPVLKKEPMS